MMAGKSRSTAVLQRRHMTFETLHRAGRLRAGYTLIELLIAIVIVGLLAALVTPRLSMARDKAFVATMKSDLRNLAQAQESFFYDNAVYAGSVGALVANGLQVDSAVVLDIGYATAAGWSVTAIHEVSGVPQCALFVGNAPPVGAATDEGLITCI
jgi:prepilin-type N-terminal cleavage/methylation domain-containing protein